MWTGRDTVYMCVFLHVVLIIFCGQGFLSKGELFDVYVYLCICTDRDTTYACICACSD
jgi:hypothetical protein